jgi:DNA-binding GntR family transcriptional regulator
MYAIMPTETAPSGRPVDGTGMQVMAGRPQKLTSLGNDALAKIRCALRDGVLVPGERIRETDLAEQFSMSRTPVREAIHVLRAKGLVSHKDGTLVITQLDRRLVDQIYAMRETLEGMSARLAATSAKAPDVEDLNVLIEHEAKAATAHRRAQLNVKFHSLLAVLADNQYLSHALEDLSEKLLLLGRTTLADDARFAEAHGEHAAVVAAVAAGDVEAAEAGMRAHIRAAWQARRSMMLSDPEASVSEATAASGRRQGRRNARV